MVALRSYERQPECISQHERQIYETKPLVRNADAKWLGLQLVFRIRPGCSERMIHGVAEECEKEDVD